MTLDQAIQFVKNRTHIICMDAVSANTIDLITKIVKVVSGQQISEFELIYQGDVFYLNTEKNSDMFFIRLRNPKQSIYNAYKVINISEIIEFDNHKSEPVHQKKALIFKGPHVILEISPSDENGRISIAIDENMDHVAVKIIDKSQAKQLIAFLQAQIK